jgi:CheY-like chemotaxis protein
MPSVGGESLWLTERRQECGRVKADTSLREAVVIAVTAHGFPADVERAMLAGCDGVVVKPYDLGALAGQVQRVVSQRQRLQS